MYCLAILHFAVGHNYRGFRIKELPVLGIGSDFKRLGAVNKRTPYNTSVGLSDKRVEAFGSVTDWSIGI